MLAMRKIIEHQDGTAYCESCETHMDFIADWCQCFKSPKQVLTEKLIGEINELIDAARDSKDTFGDSKDESSASTDQDG